MSLTREAILGRNDRPLGKVDVPEWGGVVYLSTLSVAQADKMKDIRDGSVSNVDLVIIAACDKNGEPLFTEEDRPALDAKSSKVVSKVSKAILEHNGMGATAQADAKNGSSGTESEGSASA